MATDNRPGILRSLWRALVFMGFVLYCTLWLAIALVCLLPMLIYYAARPPG